MAILDAFISHQVWLQRNASHEVDELAPPFSLGREVGNNVVVKDLEFDETLHYQIVGSQEADPMNGRISEDSPFGKALMGTKAGDEITVEAPRGVIHYRVDTIER